jgi:hypothetical protein
MVSRREAGVAIAVPQLLRLDGYLTITDPTA